MFNKRASGILVHPTSFPSPYGMGDLGEGAYKFIDFLKAAKQKLWQILPLGPTGYGDSPYQSFSSFAGNHYLISLDELKNNGLLTDNDLANIPQFDARRIDYGAAIAYKMGLLRTAYDSFCVHATVQQKNMVKEFCAANSDWLDDYALFTSLKEQHNGMEWFKWDAPLANRQPSAIEQAKQNLADTINFCKFLQYEFFRQWDALKTYANNAGVQIIGDIPIFVAHDSADVWANPQLYHLDASGRPTDVAGVPPDYFSKTGQLWGNPLYNWDIHKQTGYTWWCKRMKAVLKMVDIVRLDHFRGFESYWAVPYGEKTAIQGKWVKGPGRALFMEIKKALGDLPIIAEDLGIITDEVNELRADLNLPGMRVLQFAFTPGTNSNYLPHNYENNLTVAYTGTHDNNTTLGWYSEALEKERDFVRRYLNVSGEDIAWDLIRTAMSSVAVFAIIPIQDIMHLSACDRMNTPGESGGCWAFRYTDDMLTDEQAKRLLYLTELFYR